MPGALAKEEGDDDELGAADHAAAVAGGAASASTAAPALPGSAPRVLDDIFEGLTAADVFGSDDDDEAGGGSSAGSSSGGAGGLAGAGSSAGGARQPGPSPLMAVAASLASAPPSRPAHTGSASVASAPPLPPAPAAAAAAAAAARKPTSIAGAAATSAAGSAPAATAAPMARSGPPLLSRPPLHGAGATPALALAKPAEELVVPTKLRDTLMPFQTAGESHLFLHPLSWSTAGGRQRSVAMCPTASLAACRGPIHCRQEGPRHDLRRDGLRQDRAGGAYCLRGLLAWPCCVAASDCERAACLCPRALDCRLRSRATTSSKTLPRGRC